MKMSFVKKIKKKPFFESKPRDVKKLRQYNNENRFDSFRIRGKLEESKT